MKKKRKRIRLIRLPIIKEKRKKVVREVRKRIEVNRAPDGFIPCWIRTKKGRKFKWVPVASCIKNSEYYNEPHEDCHGCWDWVPQLYKLKMKKRKKIRRKIEVRRTIL